MEVEITLVVATPNPKALADEIAGFQSVCSYRLANRQTLHLRDIYLDTPEKVLQEHRMAMRLRTGDSETKITVKGPAEYTPSGAVSRFEFEKPWSKTAFDRLTQVLREHSHATSGISFPQLEESTHDFEGYEPLDLMLQIGWNIIQDRKTHRRLRDVSLDQDAECCLLAEFAVD